MSVEDIVAATLAGLKPNDANCASSCASNSGQPELKTLHPHGVTGIKIEHDAQDSSQDQYKTKKRKEMLKEKAKEISMRGKRAKENRKFSVEPSIVQIVKKPRTYMNHSYRDFSKVPPGITDDLTKSIKDESFPFQVHHILSQEEYVDVIRWMPHGRAFCVLVPKMLERCVLQKYFGHTRFSSFLRQLSNYGFKHITKGKDRNCYYHEFMLRGLPHLCKYMPRAKDARRLIPDPDNEPDFYAIAKIYPLPDEEQDDENAEAIASEILSDSSAGISSLNVPTPVDASVTHFLASTQGNTQSLVDQMTWLENQLNPNSSASLQNSILNYSMSAQPQVPNANLVIPPNPIPNVQSLLQTTIDRNAAVMAALGIQASQQTVGLMSGDNNGVNLGSLGDPNNAQLAAFLQSSMQRNNHQFGHY